MRLGFKIESVKRSFQNGARFVDQYLDLLANLECHFEFFVYDKIVLKSEGWNIVEFTEQLLQWQESGFKTSFRYHCMDTEDEIFSFLTFNHQFRFFSDWQNHKSCELIEQQEIERFIFQIKGATQAIVRNEFNIDLSTVDKLSFGK